MYIKSAIYYDKLYNHKDYKKEVEYLNNIICKHNKNKKSRLLDIACGTGEHIKYLKKYYIVDGLDISEELLKIAKTKNRNIRFVKSDMNNFKLDSKYDIITCLFSSIGYLKNYFELVSTINNIKNHLNSDGIILIEPWFTPEKWHAGSIHCNLIEEDHLKIVRMGTSLKKGKISYFDLHHLISSPKGTEHFAEHHEMTLFTIDEIKNSFIKNNLKVEYDPIGPSERGLYIAV